MSIQYIIELTEDELMLIAQLIHVHLKIYPNSAVGQKTLYDLMQQTNVVQGEPDRHGVYSGLTSPAGTMEISKIFYNPLGK